MSSAIPASSFAPPPCSPGRCLAPCAPVAASSLPSVTPCSVARGLSLSGTGAGFFILFMNLTGLLPIPAIAGKFPGISTATGNLGVTVVLALFTFVVTQIAGMRAQGPIGYWAHLVPAGVPKWLFPIMVPVEVLGLFTKPFALTVRLFANMVAGHIVIFFLIALTVLISPFIAPVSVAFALGIYLLELFVALVQAYVFNMLSAVFIGMTQHAH